MTYVPQAKPYTLDLGRVGSIEDLDQLPGIVNNVDFMLSQLFTDLTLVAADVATLSTTSVQKSSVVPIAGLPVPIFEDPYVEEHWPTQYLNLPLAVWQGGTGDPTLTAHGVLIGEGTSPIAATAVGATNTLLHGNTGADPTFSAVVEGDISLSDVTTANVSTTKHGFAPKLPNDATKFLDGTGVYDSIDLTTDVSGKLPVANGGTGDSTLTAHGLLIGEGTSPVVSLGAATNGQVPIGSSGADPVLAALTAGTGISITNGAGSISVGLTTPVTVPNGGSGAGTFTAH